MQLPTLFRKTFGDLSNPKLLAGYLVPFLTVAWFFGLILADSEFSGGTAPLAQQQGKLFAHFLWLSFFWGAGIPVLAITAVLGANTIAKEAQLGTLRILLSKPVSRWKVLLGSYAAVVAYAGLTALASLLLVGSVVVAMAGVSPEAVGGGIFGTLLGSVLFGTFAAAVVAAVGFALAVYTRNRLQTALGALVVPAFYFAFFPIRLLAESRYEDYGLYLLDVSYHFGNAFVYIQEAVGTDIGLRAQMELAIWTGVYEFPEEEPEGFPESLDVVGHVPQEVSVLLLAGIGVVALVVALYRFQQIDV
jgi:ABC-2 type transport system permease protein